MRSGRAGRTGLGPARIGQIAVPVDDVERATTFYRDVLGLEHLFSAPPGLAFFRCGEVRLMLSTPESPGESVEGRTPAPLVYYAVEDTGEAHDRLAAAGTRVVAEPHVVHRTRDAELWMGFYRDSEDNLFATMAEMTSAGKSG